MDIFVYILQFREAMVCPVVLFRCFASTYDMYQGQLLQLWLNRVVSSGPRTRRTKGMLDAVL